MEIEKAKEFYKGHESAPLPRIDGVIEIEENELFELLTEFAQQNTLTLDSKVDLNDENITDILELAFKHYFKYSEPYKNWTEKDLSKTIWNAIKPNLSYLKINPYKIQLGIIQQRLDNEKVLRDKIRQLRVMYDEGEIIVDTRFDAVKLENLLNQ